MQPEYVASRYRILRELGRGGMGVVYLVEHANTGEQLALKVLHGAAAADPGAITRFKREARVGSQIKSENIVRVTDADAAPELGGAPFFVMELLEGSDLEALVDNIGPVHPAVVIGVLSQVARALDKAHRIGIVHRDLKPENIFLHRRESGEPIAKILDFGISKFLSPDPTQSSDFGSTAAGTVMGTPYYMAPEQARGLVESIGPATDMWAVGLIALRMLTADLYWTARTQAELMVQILVDQLPPPSARWPWLGQAFDAWFARSCDRDPTQRWSSVTDQVAALAAALPHVNPDNPGATMATIMESHQRPPDFDPSKHLPTPDPRYASSRRSGPVANPSPWQGGTEAVSFSDQKVRSGSLAGAGSLALSQGTLKKSRLPGLLIGLAVGLIGLAVLVYRLTRPAESTDPSHTTAAGAVSSEPPLPTAKPAPAEGEANPTPTPTATVRVEIPPVAPSYPEVEPVREPPASPAPARTVARPRPLPLPLPPATGRHPKPPNPSHPAAEDPLAP